MIKFRKVSIIHFFFYVFTIFFSIAVTAQNPIGAWEINHSNESGEKLKSVYIFTDQYYSKTSFDSESGEFFETSGGSWSSDGNTIYQNIEFDSDNPNLVGTEINFQILITDSLLKIVGSDIQMTRIDDGKPGKLPGAWLMFGRTVNGQTQLRDMDNPRKTMKILSGTRFQWIAYNTETKEFMATGGGTYSTINGIYTENIEFFSRDHSRVGLELKFDYSLNEGNWHHSGLSSKGDPIDEVWRKRR